MTESYATEVGSYAPEGADLVERALKTDPLLSAEKITGESYKTSKETEALGFVLAMDHNAKLREILADAGDTYHSQTYSSYVETIESFGFTEVFTRPFKYDRYRETPITLHSCLYVHPLGLILKFDTFGWTSDKEETINGGDVYFNWKSKNPDDALIPWTVGYSGGLRNSNPDIPDKLENPNFSYDTFDVNDESTWRQIDNPEFDKSQWVLEAHIDCREGLLHKLNKLLELGDFVTPWVEVPFGMTMFNFEQSHEYYQAKGEPRHRMLEADVANWPAVVKGIVGQRAIDEYVEHSRDHWERGIF